MKIKKILAGLTAITALMGTLVSCGTEEADSNSSSETSIKVSEEEVTEAEESNAEGATSETTTEETTGEGETEETTAETSEGETSNAEEGEGDMTEEKAIELCKEAINAYVPIAKGEIDDTTIDEFLRTNNAVLIYWLGTGELLNEEEIRTAIMEDSDVGTAEGESPFDIDSIEWEKAEELNEEQVQKWETLVTEMTREETVPSTNEEIDEFDFENIESIWAVYANEKTEETEEETTSETSEEETTTTEEGTVAEEVTSFDTENPIFFVMKYNGEWKVDLASSFAIQIYQFNTNSEFETEATEPVSESGAEETTAEEATTETVSEEQAE